MRRRIETRDGDDHVIGFRTIAVEENTDAKRILPNGHRTAKLQIDAEAKKFGRFDR
jgi:hypothetical protein